MASLQDGFATRKTFDLGYRKKQLRQLKLFYDEHEEDICNALAADLGKVSWQCTFVCVSVCVCCLGSVRSCRNDCLLCNV